MADDTALLERPVDQPQAPAAPADETATAQPQEPAAPADEAAAAQPQAPAAPVDETAVAQPQEPAASADETAAAQPQEPAASADETTAAQPQEPTPQTDKAPAKPGKGQPGINAKKHRRPMPTARDRRTLFLALIAAICLAELFFFFVPVKLDARYNDVIYVYDEISRDKLLVTARTLSGNGYSITNYLKNRATVDDGPTTVKLQWGMYRTQMVLDPVPFAGYSVEYSDTHYEKEPLDNQFLSICASFTDGFVREMGIAEYTYTVDDLHDAGNALVTVDAVYGKQDAGLISMVPFRQYQVSGPTVHEGEAVDIQQYDVLAVFADEAARPVAGLRASLSGQHACDTTQIRIESVLGPHEETVGYIPITSVRADGSYTRFTVEYANGLVTDIEPAPLDPEFAAPQIISCTIEGEEVLLEMDTGANVPCIYGIFAGDDTETCVTARFGTGRMHIRIPYQPRYLREEIVVGGICESAAFQTSGGCYVTNPEVLATVTDTKPVQPSKKGLQVDTDRLSDVKALGTKHAAVNLLLSSLMGGGMAFQYDGSTYYFNSGYVRQMDRYFKSLADAGITSSAILLMRYGGSANDLVYPSGRGGGHYYYGLNASTASSRKKLAAVFTFLANRYSNDTYKVYNWILGNEVGNYRRWNYCGGLSLETYVHNYAQSFRILYNATRSVNSDCRSLISLDNCWLFNRAGTFTSRQTLDTFAADLASQGDIEWWVAYHAYSEPLTNTYFWRPHSRVTNSVDDSKMITIMNLKVLTDYVRETYGEGHKFILSENGWSSNAGQDVQAAAIAYAYYLTEANDMVESILLHRHVDHPVEMADGLYLGLRTSGGGQKRAWTVFRDMDVDPASTEFALGIIGGESWDQLLANAGF